MQQQREELAAALEGSQGDTVLLSQALEEAQALLEQMNAESETQTAELQVRTFLTDRRHISHRSELDQDAAIPCCFQKEFGRYYDTDHAFLSEEAPLLHYSLPCLREGSRSWRAIEQLWGHQPL